MKTSKLTQSTQLKYHKKYTQGATLLEVLVSVFLLTFGVLGLMAAQLRSVVVVSDSENQTYAAQAAENLAEAMQMNPILDEQGQRNFSNYTAGSNGTMKDVTKPSTCNVETTEANPTPDSNNACALTGKSKDKKTLAKVHLEEFQYILSQMPNVTNLKYTICNDKKDASKPTTTSGNCNGAQTVMIKIAWQTIPNNDPTKSPVEHSYQLQVSK